MINTVIIIVVCLVVGVVVVWRFSSSPAGNNSNNQATESNNGQVTNLTLYVSTDGYSPSNLSIKRGERVRLNLVTNKTEGCIRSFVIPNVGVSEILPETGTTTVEFTAPQSGSLGFQCSMGMFQGQFTIL